MSLNNGACMADYPINDNFWPSVDTILERYENCDSKEQWIDILKDLKQLLEDELNAVEQEN